VLRPDAKIIVFSPFISATEGIARALTKAEINFATVNGSTPAAERNRIFQAFQHGDSLKVINAHPETMSHGLTLTAADTIIWFGPTMKLRRTSRPMPAYAASAKPKQQIIKLISSTAEHNAYARLAAKQDLQASVLDLIAELTSE
jgi:hypothetical protein